MSKMFLPKCFSELFYYWNKYQTNKINCFDKSGISNMLNGMKYS